MNRSRIALALSAVTSLIFMGSRPACDTDPVSLACGSFSLELDPGGCVDIPPSCGPDWIRLDSMRLCDTPASLWIETLRAPRSRRLCSSPVVPPYFQEPFDYYYTTPTENGEGVITVTINQPLASAASANPTTIALGQTSRLSANATGGQGPYSYQWSPAATLDLSTVDSPNATPTVTTTYTVVVTDANGAQATSSVTVFVNAADVTVVANPSTIVNGDFTQLTATPIAGVGPYTYTWDPAALISPQGSDSVFAFPNETTTFTVTIVDSNGSVFTGSVEVVVLLEAFTTASPQSLMMGQTSQLDTFAAGGTPPYSYSWTPAGSLSDPNIANPVASPVATTTYVVTVTDALGASVTATQVVNVQAGPALNACFTITPIGPFTISVDASCSTGTIIEYWYWPDFTSPADPPDIVSGSSTANLTFTSSGPKNVRVEVFDINGNTSAAVQTYFVP